MTCLSQPVVGGVTLTVGDTAPLTSVWQDPFHPQQWIKPGESIQELRSWDRRHGARPLVNVEFTSYSVSLDQQGPFSLLL